MERVKRILITGSAGMLANAVGPILQEDLNYEVYACDRLQTLWADATHQKHFDLTDSDQLKMYLDRIEPDIIIHCLALVDLEYCETHPQVAGDVHEGITYTLAHHCPQTSFVYISTDSVFDGEQGNYSETDEPKPLNVYARTKLAGEQVVLQESRKPLVLRTNIYGFKNPPGGSLAEWALTHLLKGESIGGFTDVMFNALYIRQLAGTIKQLLSSDCRGVLHVGSQDHFSKYDFLIKLARECMRPTSLIRSTTSEHMLFKAKRPRDTTLDVSKFTSLVTSVPVIEEGIKALVEDYRKVFA